MKGHLVLIAIFLFPTNSFKCSKSSDFVMKLHTDFGINDIKEITKQNFISKGGVGKVYKLTYKNPKVKEKFAAAKVVEAISEADQENLDNIDLLKNEIEALEDLHAKKISKIPKFIACYVDSLMAILVMEYLPFNLDPCDYTRNPTKCKKHSFNEEFIKLPVSRQLFYFSEILSAIDGLHQKNLVHHDLKPENIMLTEPNKKNEREVRLCDFGTLAREGDSYGGATINYADYETWAFWENSDYKFLAESLKTKSEKKADIYAAAITFFVILNGLQSEIYFIKRNKNTSLTKRISQINKKVSSQKWMADKNILVCTKDKKICFEKLMQEMLADRSKKTKSAKDLSESFKKLAENVKEEEEKQKKGEKEKTKSKKKTGCWFWI